MVLSGSHLTSFSMICKDIESRKIDYRVRIPSIIGNILGNLTAVTKICCMCAQSSGSAPFLWHPLGDNATSGAAFSLLASSSHTFQWDQVRETSANISRSCRVVLVLPSSQARLLPFVQTPRGGGTLLNSLAQASSLPAGRQAGRDF